MKLLNALKLNVVKRSLKKKRKEFSRMPVKGERFTVPRTGQDGVDVILYRPDEISDGLQPVLFNLHGGAWVGGDAVLMDSFCTYMANEIPAFIVNVNYKKVDVHPFPYPQTELCDAVLYFADHAVEYGLDKTKFIIGGHSAGAHISAGAAMRLKELGFVLAGQMLVYPFTDFTAPFSLDSKDNDEDKVKGLAALLDMLREMCFSELKPDHRWLSPMSAAYEELQGLAPTVIVVCGKDALRPHGTGYAKRLEDAGVKVLLKEYPEAEHGFLEVNRPEYTEHEAIGPEQAEMARDCEKFLIMTFKNIFNSGSI